MNKIQELEAKLQELQEEIASLKVQEEKVKHWPKVGDVFYVPTCLDSFLFDEADEQDISLLEQGAVFRTKEEAQSEFETRKVFEELRKQPGRVFEFSEYGNDSWTISFCEGGIFPETWATYSSLMLGVYSSKYAVRDAINAVGEERIRKAVNWFVNRKVW